MLDSGFAFCFCGGPCGCHYGCRLGRDDSSIGCAPGADLLPNPTSDGSEKKEESPEPVRCRTPPVCAQCYTTYWHPAWHPAWQESWRCLSTSSRKSPVPTVCRACVEAINHEFDYQSAAVRKFLGSKIVAMSGGCRFSFPPHGALAMMLQWRIRGADDQED